MNRKARTNERKERRETKSTDVSGGWEGDRNESVALCINLRSIEKQKKGVGEEFALKGASAKLKFNRARLENSAIRCRSLSMEYPMDQWRNHRGTREFETFFGIFTERAKMKQTRKSHSL